MTTTGREYDDEAGASRYPAPQLIDVHQPAPRERADERIGQDLPILERVLAAIDRLVSWQTATIVNTALHAIDPTDPVGTPG